MQPMSRSSGMPENNVPSYSQKLPAYLDTNLSALWERQTQSDETLKFLLEAIEAVSTGQGDPQAVYPLVVENQELLDVHLIYVLQKWCREIFSDRPKKEKARIAGALVDLGRIIWALPEGDPDITLEIAIACGELALEVYSWEKFPQQWAIAHNNLALAYSERCCGDIVENDLKSYSHYQQAQRVFVFQAFPQQWSRTS